VSDIQTGERLFQNIMVLYTQCSDIFEFAAAVNELLLSEGIDDHLGTELWGRLVARDV